nr:S41 family peptidase [Chloroflexaceae bacterium]
APDGTGLYFVSDAGGCENLWFQPLDGGPAHPVTDFNVGRLLWPAIARQAGLLVFERDGQIWRLDVASGESAPIPIRARADAKFTPVRVEGWSRGLSEFALSPDGKKVAFVVRGEVFADFADKETDKEQRQGPSFRITNTAARERAVTWTPDSRSLVYISDRHGEDELYRYDFGSGSETRLTSDQAPKNRPCISPDGTTLAYVRTMDSIHLLNMRSGESRPFAQGIFVAVGGLAWSPDSRWLAFLAHDSRSFCNVYVQHVDETEARQISFLSHIEGSDLLWSPDGRFLIFTTGQYRQESQIARLELRPPQPRFREREFDRLFEEKKKKTDRRPETGDRSQPAVGSWQLAEPKTVGADTRVGLLASPPLSPPHAGRNDTVEANDEERETPLAPEPGDAPAPAPAPAEPKPKGSDGDHVEIVFAGIERRLRFLTPIQMNASAETINPEGPDLLFLATVAGKTNIWSLPLDEPRADQPPRQLTANGNSKWLLQFAPDGKTFFYLDDGQITIRKFPNGNDPATLPVRGEVTVDFHQEKLQVFGEAWRLLRDSFYDPAFRGLDWLAIRERYAPLAAGARTHDDLHTVLNLMAGELRASHMGVSYGGGWSGNDGYTGLLFDQAELAEQGRLRISGVLPDSPAALAETPPQVGEYLLAVDGVALTPTTSLERLLQRTVGRRVSLRLASEPEGETREVAVRPVDSDDYETLRYRAWVAERAALVQRLSENRLGYVHVAEMSYSAYQQFLVDLDAEAHHKAGIVLDVRYNSGGHIATFMLDVLSRRSTLLSGFRDRTRLDAGHMSGNRVLNKPTVLLINERSASNTEMFVESYRRLGLGTVVGRPTAGAVIWTTSARLLDGASFRLPRFYTSTPEGEDLEGNGRLPDIDVAQPLGAWQRGDDPQLAAAVAALLARLE